MGNIIIAIFVFLLLPLALTWAIFKVKQLNSPAFPNVEPHIEPVNRNPVASDSVNKKSRWTYRESNLHKAILKGRRQGHLRIMYHGTWYNTGLQNREMDTKALLKNGKNS